jgi:inorganic triphosphatase YgiF
VGTKHQNEIELKLIALDGALLDELWSGESIWDWWVVGRGHERQRNVYYDTPDGALKARGASLRWRSRLDEGTGELTLKTGRERHGCIFQRQELTTSLERPPATLGDDPPPPLSAAQRLAGSALQPVLVLETDRRTLEVERGESRVEVALDRVTLPGVDFVEHEIEAELLRGNRGDLLGMQAALLSTGRTRPTSHGKRGRALRYLASHCDRGLLAADQFRARLPA